MKYGISVRQIPKQVYERVIIPGLSPGQVMATVSLGMSRPQWIKYILSAIANNELDATDPYDRYRLIFDEKTGLLFQAFVWKRVTYESNSDSSGFGMGFIQMRSSGSLSVLPPGLSADRLFTEILNDLLEKLNKQEIEKSTEEFRSCFNPRPNYEKTLERFNKLNNKSEVEKKQGILSAFVWAIEEALTEKFESPEEKARAFTIPTLLLGMVEDIKATDKSKFSKVTQILTSEKPGEMSTELSSVENAALIYELLKSERSQAIIISFIVFDLVRDELPSTSMDDIDSILREAKINLPDYEQIQKYLKKIYNRIVELLSRYVKSSEIMTYNEFLQICGPEKVQKIAVLWEYNIIAGELEEMLRDFIYEKTTPPYEFSFLERWDNMFKENWEYWSEIIERFGELAESVVNEEVYQSAFWIDNEDLLNLSDWFVTVFSEFNKVQDISDKLKVLLELGGLLGEAISFDGKNVNVIKRPSRGHPLIARDAVYEWLRTFRGIWR